MGTIIYLVNSIIYYIQLDQLQPVSHPFSTLRSSQSEQHLTAFLMCAWSFSPYNADWWRCKVALSSHDADGGSRYDIQPDWKNANQVFLPIIHSQSELALEIANKPGDIQWTVVPYQVSWYQFMSMLTQLKFTCFMFIVTCYQVGQIRLYYHVLLFIVCMIDEV